MLYSHRRSSLLQLRKVIDIFNKKALNITDSADAAVAMLLKEDNKILQIFLVKRSPLQADPWSGHMAFPGGRRNPSDTNLKDTVMRETLEETRINLEKCRLLGTLSPINSEFISGIRVLPFIFVCEESQEIELNYELSSYYWIPLDKLKDSICSIQIGNRNMPAYIIGDEVIWGLTYRMLEAFYRLTT